MTRRVRLTEVQHLVLGSLDEIPDEPPTLYGVATAARFLGGASSMKFRPMSDSGETPAKRIVGSSLGGVAQPGGATTAFTTSASTNTVAFTPETVYFTR
jgi:hypothetical protein